MDDIQLSEHFLLSEMARSQTALRQGIDNTPDADSLENLRVLCNTLLEPVRTLLGVPLHIDSGYRSPILNSAVGGAFDSAHLEGRAADVIPIGMDLHVAFLAIEKSPLSFDQLIIECNAWLHISIPPAGAVPRHELLVATGTPGHWTYEAA
jgi:hypothetical protein